MLTFDASRISQISASGQKVQNLACLLTVDFLRACYTELDPNKAPGIDGVTKKEYGQNLNANLEALVSRMKKGTYTPQPSRRVYIDKPGTNKKRPLGISCLEDKIVERAIAKILVAVYEPKFLDCSYGFRPNRSCHQAVSTLLGYINQKTNYVVEADIRSCFDTINHEWLIKFLENDIADKKFIELVNRGLKAGHFEDGIYQIHTEGTMQGSGYSPVLANVYLHYVLDRWFRHLKETAPEMWRFRGSAQLVRYADDFVCCFQYKNEALNFYQWLIPHFRKYGFELAPEKTRVIQFGRFAELDIQKMHEQGKTDQTKPGTFNFLGFTFYCGKSAKTGKFSCKVKSDSKRVRTKLAKQKAWLAEHRGLKLKEVIGHFNDVLKGYFNYYAVTCNFNAVAAFRYHVIGYIFKWLNRRSQRKSYTWEGFCHMLQYYPVVKARIKVNIYTFRDDMTRQRSWMPELGTSRSVRG